VAPLPQDQFLLNPGQQPDDLDANPIQHQAFKPLLISSSSNSAALAAGVETEEAEQPRKTMPEIKAAVLKEYWDHKNSPATQGKVFPSAEAARRHRVNSKTIIKWISAADPDRKKAGCGNKNHPNKEPFTQAYLNGELQGLTALKLGKTYGISSNTAYQWSKEAQTRKKQQMAPAGVINTFQLPAPPAANQSNSSSSAAAAAPPSTAASLNTPSSVDDSSDVIGWTIITPEDISAFLNLREEPTINGDNLDRAQDIIQEATIPPSAPSASQHSSSSSAVYQITPSTAADSNQASSSVNSFTKLPKDEQVQIHAIILKVFSTPVTETTMSNLQNSIAKVRGISLDPDTVKQMVRDYRETKRAVLQQYDEYRAHNPEISMPAIRKKFAFQDSQKVDIRIILNWIDAADAQNQKQNKQSAITTVSAAQANSSSSSSAAAAAKPEQSLEAIKQIFHM
jgi:transposase-like protein